MKKYKKCKISSRKKKDTLTKIKRRIHKKINLIQYSLKDIPQIFSPHNTTQYLIENNSSPFYFDEDEEEDFNLNLNLNPLLSLDSGNTFLSSFAQEEFKVSYPDNELVSTAAQSQESQNFKLSIE